MKNNSKIGTLAILLIASAVLIYFNTQVKEKNQQQTTTAETTSEVNKDSEQAKVTKANDIKIEDPKKYVEDQQIIVRTNQIKKEFKECFEGLKLPDVLQNENVALSAAESLIQKSQKFSEVTIEKEQYSLKSTDGKLFEVQYINGEDDKNKVRVFSISQLDGFPDRVNNFPNSTAELKERLNGALSLGQIVMHTTSGRQRGPDQEILEVEKTSSEVLSIHYKDSKKEFLCEKNSCKCVK